MSRIFISYRRDDSASDAGRLLDRLSAHFGKEQIFMDLDIELGSDFIEVIDEKVTSCDVLISVIGKKWLSITDRNGRRRLDDPNDFVRLENAAALDRNIPVIPALVSGATMPRASDLPDVLSRLARRQAIEITHTRFHTDVNRLIKALEKFLAGKKVDAPKVATSEKRPVERVPKIRKRAKSRTAPVPDSSPIIEDVETGLMWTQLDNQKDINWHAANSYAESLDIGGYKDWRLPTFGELKGLHDPRMPGTFKIRKTFSLSRGSVWSSTVDNLESAWIFYFSEGDGFTLPLTTSEGNRALCVRDVRMGGGGFTQGEKETQKRRITLSEKPAYEVVDNLIVRDQGTGLMWTRKDNGVDLNWHEANEYAKNLKLGGYTDWRLPTIEELENLYDHNYGTDPDVEALFEVTDGCVWSNTKRSADTVWGFHFDRGERGPVFLGFTMRSPRALCVRDISQ